MTKNIYIIFSDYPFGTNKTSEKLRLIVGLALNDENVLNLVFMGNSRYALQKLDETKKNTKPVFKHIDMLMQVGAKFYVEKGGCFSIIPDIKAQKIQTHELNDLIDEADLIIH